MKNFQKQKGLAASGNLTSATVDAINGPRNDRSADVIVANLERWRWITHDLGPAHVVVNIPEFMLRVYNNGSLLWRRGSWSASRATPTPLMSETMKYITVNPTWNVPPSIVYGEYLPALRQDPTVLARMGLHVSYSRRTAACTSRSRPGAGNALGRIRFNFPNKFLVYQHDTPDKYMFAHEKRAYSHGCMRVQDPDKYAEVLLSIALPNEGYTADRIRRHVRTGRDRLQVPDANSGPPDLPDRIRRRRRQAHSARRRLRTRFTGDRGAKSDDSRIADTPMAEAPRRATSPATRRQVYRCRNRNRAGSTSSVCSADDGPSLILPRAGHGGGEGGTVTVNQGPFSSSEAGGICAAGTTRAAVGSKGRKAGNAAGSSPGSKPPRSDAGSSPHPRTRSRRPPPP